MHEALLPPTEKEASAVVDAAAAGSSLTVPDVSLQQVASAVVLDVGAKLPPVLEVAQFVKDQSAAGDDIMAAAVGKAEEKGESQRQPEKSVVHLWLPLRQSKTVVGVA